ncbi:MAG: tetratricopeptide repeat protein [Kiloniellales bacterium]
MIRLIAAFFALYFVLTGHGQARGYQDAATCFTLINEGGDLESAVIHCTRAIDSRELRGGDLAPVYYNRGWAHDALGDYRRAVEDYGRALHIRPDYVRAYVARGYSFVQLGDLDRAIEDYSRALEVEPDNFEARFNRGLAYEQKGELAQALADYERAQALRPGETRVQNILKRLQHD